MENMTYVSAITELKEYPMGHDSSGNEANNVIRRAAWKDGLVMAIITGRPKMAMAALNPSTGKRTMPQVESGVTSPEDLWSNDWEFIRAEEYY